MTTEWYCKFAGRNVGPISAERLRQHAQSGVITADTLVRRADRGEWVKVKQVKGLLSDAASTPPPMAAAPVGEKATMSTNARGQWLVSYDCPKCGARQKSPIGDAGNQGDCTECQAGFVVPGEAKRREVEEQEALQAEKLAKDEEERILKKERQLRMEQRRQAAKARQSDAVKRERDRNAKGRADGSATGVGIKVFLAVLAALAVWSVIGPGTKPWADFWRGYERGYRSAPAGVSTRLDLSDRNLERLEPSVSLSRVESVVGGEGERISMIEFSDGSTHERYIWREGGVSLQVVFDDGKLDHWAK